MAIQSYGRRSCGRLKRRLGGACVAVAYFLAEENQ